MYFYLPAWVGYGYLFTNKHVLNAIIFYFKGIPWVLNSVVNSNKRFKRARRGNEKSVNQKPEFP